jgi:hypothetical protein
MGEPYEYGIPPNRSPNSSRAYRGASGAFGLGFSLPRHGGRAFDQSQGLAGLYGDRMPPPYNMRAGLEQMGPAPALPNSYMMDNAQSWTYNAGAVNTIGAGRQRSARRPQLPQPWADTGIMGMQPQMGFQPPGLGNPMQGMRMDAGQVDARGGAGDSDQLIPTAIVIKNIPFAVRKEQLAHLMTELKLPQPYAFNYHFDGGIFRGLAFANFSTPEETRLVIDTMNGYDVQGRKLRVEYKKMLPEAERERIEREKRERRGQLEEQHRAPVLHQQPSLPAMSSIANNQQNQRQTATHLRKTPDDGPLSLSGPTLTGCAPAGNVDLNDPITLQYYTELTLFRRDESREVLIFPPTVSPEERRQIHILAHFMGLEHRSVGEHDSRQIQVFKNEVAPSPTTHNTSSVASVGLDLHRRGLSRAATYDNIGDREPRITTNSYSHSNLRGHPTLEVPGSPDAGGFPSNLRAAKSFADLRSFSPSPSHSSSGYLNPGPGGMGAMSSAAMTSRINDYTGSLSQASSSLATPTLTPTPPGTASSNDATALAGTLSGLNLGSFESNTVHRSTPGAIGSHRPSANGTTGNRAAPDRQPRGPEWETCGGFGRGRPNGHMARGSGKFRP